jgi:hypothetical protein
VELYGKDIYEMCLILYRLNLAEEGIYSFMVAGRKGRQSCNVQVELYASSPQWHITRWTY